MSAVATYFRNIKEAAMTVFDGMSVSLSYLFRQPITVQYPDKTPEPVIDMIPTGYRGILDVDITKCTACLVCMRTCPVQCINITVEKLGDPPKRMLTDFGINLAKCMFCGLCSEQCPTQAIYHTKEFEGASRDFDDLVLFFVKEPAAPYKQPKKDKPKLTPEQIESMKKAAAAKKAAGGEGAAKKKKVELTPERIEELKKIAAAKRAAKKEKEAAENGEKQP